MISEMRKIKLQIRLFVIFMFHLMLWNTLHMILTPLKTFNLALMELPVKELQKADVK